MRRPEFGEGVPFWEWWRALWQVYPVSMTLCLLAPAWALFAVGMAARALVTKGAFLTVLTWDVLAFVGGGAVMRVSDFTSRWEEER